MSLHSLWDEAAPLDGPKDMVLLSELQNYCQTIETPTLPDRPALEINSDAACYSRSSKTKSAYNFKIANHKVAPTDD